MRVSSPVRATYALLVTLCLPIWALAQHEPSINVGLQTSFDSAPYLLELLETAALENSTSYFPLLDRIADGAFADLHTDEQLYKRFIEVLQQDGHLDSAEALSSFKYALALHAAAPRIEAHYQYYRTAVESQMMAAQDAVCPVWVHLDGQQYCSPTLERAQQPVDVEEPDTELPFDRSLGDAQDVPVSVLYADITQPLFAQFHETVSSTAREGKSIYRVRYRPSANVQRPLFVSGYGAELVLKRTDYIVIDDRDADAKEDLKSDNSRAEDKASDLKPLTKLELASLGLSAASYILSSEDPFATLVDVSANFPKFSAQIAATKASSKFLEEHYANRDILLPPGFNVIWMNGLQIEQRNINAYSLLDILKRERQLMKQLNQIGLTSTQAVDILSHDVLAQSLANEEPQRYDWRDDGEGNAAIVWLNNIEHDRRYNGWMSTLQLLLQRTYPGQLPQIRRNIHNLIVPIDLANIEDLDLVVNTLQTIVKRLIPIRVGLVPAGNSDSALTGVRLSYHLIDTYGASTLMHFYQNLVQSKKGLSAIEAIFEESVKDREPREGKSVLSFAEAVDEGSTGPHVQASENYINRLALGELDNYSVVINGVILPRDESWFDKVSQKLVADQRMLQIEVYEQRLTDEMNVAEVMLSTATPRRNTLIVPSDPKNVTILNVADISSEYENSFSRLPKLLGGESSLLSEQGHILLVANFDVDAGRNLLIAADEFHTKHPEVEIAVLHNPVGSNDDDALAARLFAFSDNERASIDQELNNILSSDTSEADLSTEQVQTANDFWAAQRPLIKQLGVKHGEPSLWFNGRIVGPIISNFGPEDFEALCLYEKTTRIAPVTTAITGVGLEEKFTSPLDLAKLTSIVARSLVSDVPQGIYEAAPPVRMNVFKQFRGEHSSIHIPSSEEPTIRIVAAVDPASEVAQPWIPILKTLSELDGIDVRVYLNPKNHLEELPVKRFYRQVISSSPSFDADGNLNIPRASFSSIPRDTLFNLGMVVPPSWLVAPKKSVHDLDNIKLSSVPTGQDIDATYELEHILIEGHSRESAKGSPPRGVQLLLGTEATKHHTDTIIMANLGYFQFKANPGHWQISLKPGRSSKIFTIDSVGAKGYAPQPGDETTSVSLLSFQGVTLYPRLSRKPGMEKEEVLESSVAGSAMDYLGKGASFASSALSSLGWKKDSSAENSDINIFSVASGHLYERMLNIMMVSVMRHTKHSVKFWFIEQFLSPSFKSSLPVLASHYKFDYEMVTYKWPHWLRGQKEKQREIWGYKILFLDVLFPLNLDKVIFVDADQIVRTDMMELNKVDLQGAPYGFTPMCDSRTEMEGFRFWKQGYWKNYLDGKPYHISALYVVDLKNFRQLAAGDRLRQQYHALSADPASLSNLDQDLPNHMQHVLPIHSLPQEWLWCETWCSDESLKDARTIDLCNNPQTKEPKLDRARRQVPEWTEYDDEIAQVLKNVKGDDDQAFIKDGGVQEDEQKVLSDQDRKKDEL